MRATAWLAGAATVGLLATGCGSPAARHGSGTGNAGGHSSTGETAARRTASGPATLTRPQAARLAAALLRRATEPAGARPATGRLPIAISQPPATIGASPVTDVHRVWTVAGKAGTVFTTICERAPAGMVWSGSGSGADRGAAGEQFVSYRLPHLPAGVYQASLVMSVAPGSAGHALVRADAEVIWYPAHPADEHIPASLHAVRISTSGGLPTPSRTSAVTVTTPSEVRHLAALLNGARVSPAGAIPCPMPMITYRLAFAASATAKAAVVAVDPGCPGVEMTVNGQTRPILVTPAGLISSVRGLMRGVQAK